MTLASERFIALHINTVSSEPAAPTSVPAIIMDMFFMANPVTAAARPVQEFKTEMTTGMSAPPMGSTCKTPRSKRKRGENDDPS